MEDKRMYDTLWKLAIVNLFIFAVDSFFIKITSPYTGKWWQGLLAVVGVISLLLSVGMTVAIFIMTV